jgi:hypothetical protein
MIRLAWTTGATAQSVMGTWPRSPKDSTVFLGGSGPTRTDRGGEEERGETVALAK